ncbi:hypothetical protein X798_02380 [Onchocerca flexuosa]|nr:hypothetical protein X798_02380 [Onchocerca flexuosa]
MGMEVDERTMVIEEGTRVMVLRMGIDFGDCEVSLVSECAYSEFRRLFRDICSGAQIYELKFKQKFRELLGKVAVFIQKF